jgi:predicted GNAT family acetyltransferase
VVIEWVAAFMEHAGEQGDAAALARDRIGRGLLYLWEADGPVSMAAWTGKTPNGVRVNLVYTPPALRGKGYATACVTGLSTLLLQHNRFCCLYTDLANPTSNAIYHRIGYRPVCDAAVYLVRDEGLS